jgi:hypothetical protein
MNHDLPIPNTPSHGNRLEVCSSMSIYCASSNTVWKFTPLTTGPYNRAFVGSLRNLSADTGHSRSQQPTAGTSMYAEWTLAPPYLAEPIVPGNFHQSTNVQEYISPINSPREPEGTIPASYTRHGHLQHQQLHPTVAGSCNPTVYLPTPVVGAKSLQDGSPIQEQPRSLPRRVHQKRRPESLSPPVGGAPSPRHAANQAASHPYPRPANVRH